MTVGEIMEILEKLDKNIECQGTWGIPIISVQARYDEDSDTTIVHIV